MVRCMYNAAERNVLGAVSGERIVTGKLKGGTLEDLVRDVYISIGSERRGPSSTAVGFFRDLLRNR